MDPTDSPAGVQSPFTNHTPALDLTYFARERARVLNPNGMANMTSRKRFDSKTPKPLPTRSCIICTEFEDEIQLIKPCRSCNMDYCVNCLVDMFEAATTDNTRMPPRCCNLIQIHTILGKLTPEVAKTYRDKFEEWITPVKTYCPSPTCSAFISERKLPANINTQSTKSEIPSLKTLLIEVVENLTKTSVARFFRGTMDITQLPGYTKVIACPMDLSIIRNRLQSSYYQSTADLTIDMRLITTNAKEYTDENHPIAKTAEEFFERYLKEISKVTDRLIRQLTEQYADAMFACPECHIAVCVSCKQIEHTGAPCDTSAQDHEIAMLETFGYKRCPRCKAGVKKMYGCPHIQCVCGAHWCYFCQRSIELCDGACDARADDEDLEDLEEDDYDSEAESELSGSHEERIVAPQPGLLPSGTATRSSAPVVLGSMLAVPPTNAPAPPPPPNANTPANLDAGGARRWAESELDFGEEPEDEGIAQVWSCKHKFERYQAPSDDGINRGDLSKMECNRCFTPVKPKSPVPMPSTKKRRKIGSSRGSQTDPIVILDESSPPVPEMRPMQLAWECIRCKLVVCVGCKDKYKVVQSDPS